MHQLMPHIGAPANQRVTQRMGRLPQGPGDSQEPRADLENDFAVVVSSVHHTNQTHLSSPPISP